MKIKESKPDIVYRVINSKTGETLSSYSRAYCNEVDFLSPEEARNSNVYGMFKDKKKYKIAKYKVKYILLNSDYD